MLRYTAVKMIHFSPGSRLQGYSYGNHTDLGHVSFKDLKGGRVIINGKEGCNHSTVQLSPARQIAAILVLIKPANLN